MGDVQAGAVKLMLEQDFPRSEDEDTALDKYKVWSEGENLKIAYRDQAMCLSLPRHLLSDPNFDLIRWFDDTAAEYYTTDSTDESDLEYPSDEFYSMPSLQDVESSKNGSSYTSGMPSLQSVSHSEPSISGGDTESDFNSMPPLQSVSDSSSESSSENSDSGSNSGPSEDEYDALEERLRIWACVAAETGHTCVEPVLRARHLRDILGNTVAALLEFFQPYPGDERISWSDERRDSKRFRVLRPTGDFYTIEDSFGDEVMVLPLEYLRVPAFHVVEWYASKRARALGIEDHQASPIHRFPVEELLADAIQQYFQDIGKYLPTKSVLAEFLGNLTTWRGLTSS